MNDDDRGKMNYMKEYSKYSSLIFQMIVMVAAGVLGGIQLDRLLKMKGPVFTIGLTIFSSFLAIYYLFKTLLKK
ncbi:MAG: AtpZ/AtpI family protein [Bacteroidia bacterium]|nr:AtpZ/AtpI family protein [Bacteroidia bacterium]